MFILPVKTKIEKKPEWLMILNSFFFGLSDFQLFFRLRNHNRRIFFSKSWIFSWRFFPKNLILNRKDFKKITFCFNWLRKNDKNFNSRAILRNMILHEVFRESQTLQKTLSIKKILKQMVSKNLDFELKFLLLVRFWIVFLLRITSRW